MFWAESMKLRNIGWELCVKNMNTFINTIGTWAKLVVALTMLETLFL